MSDEATGKSGKTWFHVVVVVLLYAFSTGPAFVLVERKAIPEASLAIYLPLSLGCHVTGADPALVYYLRGWLDLTHTPVPRLL
jgi:hypothetical protein